MGRVVGAMVAVNEEVKFLWRCERRSEVFVKIQKKNIFWVESGLGGGVSG